MASFNKVILIGNLCADPELKTTPNGVSVTSFRVAAGRRKVNGQEPQTAFVNVVAWRNTAEFICKYFRKGNPILIIGSIQTRNWTDTNGNKRYATDVVADEAQFVSNKNGGEANQSHSQNGNFQNTPYSVDSAGFEECGDEELPF